MFRAAPGLRISSIVKWWLIKDRKQYQTWVLGQLATERPTRLIPAHGAVISDPDLASALASLVKTRFWMRFIAGGIGVGSRKRYLVMMSRSDGVVVAGTATPIQKRDLTKSIAGFHDLWKLSLLLRELAECKSRGWPRRKAYRLARPVRRIWRQCDRTPNRKGWNLLKHRCGMATEKTRASAVKATSGFLLWNPASNVRLVSSTWQILILNALTMALDDEVAGLLAQWWQPKSTWTEEQMIMYSNKLSAVQWRRNHSTFKAHSVKELVMTIAKIIRTNAIRTTWIMFTFVPMVMVYNAARADESVATQRVSFKDLNLSSPEGATALYGRIKRAANEVCGHGEKFDLSQIHAVQTCIDGAVSRAVAQVNSPTLTSLYNEKTGKADKKITLAQSR
jgi:UrcA family protein